MKCYICDKDLSDKEIHYNEDMKAYEPCSYCLEAAMDAAYCDGFNIEEDDLVVIDELDPFPDFSLNVHDFDIPYIPSLKTPHENE